MESKVEKDMHSLYGSLDLYSFYMKEENWEPLETALNTLFKDLANYGATTPFVRASVKTVEFDDAPDKSRFRIEFEWLVPDKEKE